MKRKLAVIIPARNEEKVLPGCLQQLVKIMDKKDIYLINDCSFDQTAKIAKRFTKNILSLTVKSGKAIGLNKAIKYFNLTKKYQYIFPLDADTKIDKVFLQVVLDTFAGDKKGKIAAVIGKISGHLLSAIAAYRVWEYEISQAIHKNAQSSLNAITVCSGCTTVYRSDIFTKILFSDDTLTEDMDLTFTIHRQNLGKIVYIPQAVAKTQDPQSLSDLKKQLDRWYGGFWQCVLKHKIPLGGQVLDFEVGWTAFEGVFNGLFVLILLLLLPLILIKAGLIAAVAVTIDLLFFTIPTMLFVAWKQKNIGIFKYLLHFYFLRGFSALIFLKSYIVKSAGLDSTVKWNQAQRFILQGA